MEELKLIRLLQRDASLTIREIADRLGMRPSTVHEKIKRLKRQGVLKRKVWILDDEKLGTDFVAFILVKGKPGKYLSEKNILADRRVQEAWGVTGNYDILLKCRFKDFKEFSRFLIEMREKLEEYNVETFTMIGTAKLKESHELPI